MPGSTAETLYGRQGGGWLPNTKPAKPTKAPPTTGKAKKSDKGPDCKVCHRPYGDHSGKTCLACNAPIEHHTRDYEDACWAGRARMAEAKRSASLPLNHVDRLALDRTGENR